MSEVRVNKLSPRSGTTVTLGDSGDTITIPSGVTLSTASFSSTGIDDNATSTAITIDSSQNVGIGTASPTEKLEVAGNLILDATDSNIKIKSGVGGTTGAVNWTFNTDSTSYASISLAYDTRATTGLLIQTTTGYPITLNAGNGVIFQEDSSETMRINSSGNVGIGTSSPDNLLHIEGDQPTYKLTSTNPLSTAVGTETISDIDFEGQNNNLYRTTARIRARQDGTWSTGTANFAPTALDFFTQDNSTSDAMTSPRMTINEDGNVGIGTSSPENNLHIFTNNGGEGLTIKSTGNTSNAIIVDANRSSAGNAINQLLGRWNGTDVADIIFQTGSDTTNKDDGIITFRTSSANNISERMRIDSSGNVFVAKTSDAFASTVGIGLLSTGQSQFVASNQGLLYCNRLNSDGQLVIFFAQNTEEGSINVSGSTVSYNGFTGTHWSRFTDNSTPTILRGTVLETLDEMCDWYNLEFDVITQDADGNDVTTPQKIPHVLTDTQSVGDVITYNHEGTDYQATIVKEADIKHMKSKVSDTVDAKNVYGVFVAYDEDGEGYNDFYVASVGSFVVRIKANETIAKGDLLQSNGDGTAKVQTDDNVKSSSFAKVLSTTIIETYEDGSYLVPCSLNC